MWTPCDEMQEKYDEEMETIVKKSVCPYADSYTGYESEMCRVCCGLGVDE